MTKTVTHMKNAYRALSRTTFQPYVDKMSVLINKHEPHAETKLSEFAAHSVYCTHKVHLQTMYKICPNILAFRKRVRNFQS